MKEYKVEVKVEDNGTKIWFLNGKCHREDGPAIEHANGDKFWYLNGELHREDGPAVERADGTKFWFLNDERHREDGPAVERADGTKEWYLNGTRVTEADVMSPKSPCTDKIVTIDGVQYRLTALTNND